MILSCINPQNRMQQVLVQTMLAVNVCHSPPYLGPFWVGPSKVPLLTGKYSWLLSCNAEHPAHRAADTHILNTAK